MRTFDIDHLRAFLAIAETGSFSRAARQVHRTQAAVSVQIKRLEETVGARLIDRQPRRSVLTPEGARLRGYAARMVRLNDEALAALSGEDLSGRLRIGAPLYVQSLLPEILAQFARAHPQVELELLTAPSQDMLAETNDAMLDVSLLALRPGSDAGELLRREPLFWVCAPLHDAHARPVVPLALFYPTSLLRDIATETLERAGRPFRIAYSSPNTDAICQAVAAGLAVAILPRCSVRSDFRILTPEHGYPDLPPFNLCLARAPRPETPTRRAFVTHLTASLRRHEALADTPPPLPTTPQTPAVDTTGAVA